VISVIIPVKNGGDGLRRCLEGIAAQRAGEPIEILVADSGSTDDSRQVARSLGAEVLEVDSPSFLHGATRNLAASRARGDVLVFTTQDAYPENERWLEQLCASLRADELVAGVYGRQIPHDDAAPPEQFFLDFLYGPEPRDQRVAAVADLSMRTTLFSNVNSAMHRRLWEKFPFADDLYFQEDQDWSRRVLLAGYTIRYEPGAAVRHSHTYTLRTAFRRFFDTGASAERGFLGGGASSSKSLRREAFRYAREELAWLIRTGQRRWIPHAAAYELTKFLGLQIGARHRMLPLWLKLRFSSYPGYWRQADRDAAAR